MDAYKVTQLKSDIFRIQETWYKEHANIYLIKGSKRSLLVDCGLGIVDIRPCLQKLGVKEVIVAVTHSHYDHAGGLRYFKPSEMYIPKKVKQNLSCIDLLGLGFLNTSDFEPQTKQITGYKPQEICRDIKITVPECDASDHDIDLGNYSFQLISTPGHSDDCHVYYDTKNKLLIGGDTLYNGIVIAFKNTDVQNWKRSINLLLDLDFDYVLPGHNEELTRETAEAAATRLISDM